MRRLAPILLGAVAAGCASPAPMTVLHWPEDRTHDASHERNLLFGEHPGEIRLAQLLAGRSDWPSVAMGYEQEDVTFVTEWSIDDQSFTDRLGGGYYGGTETIRTRVRVR